MGRQLIHASERFVDEPDGRVRIFRDSGIPLTGPLASLDVWDHQMAISPAPGDPVEDAVARSARDRRPDRARAVARAVDDLAVARGAHPRARADLGARPRAASATDA